MNINFNNLTYNYSQKDDFLLSIPNLEIQTTGITALIGANGSGKSTLIKILTGQFINFKGMYSLDDQVPTNRYGDLLYRYKIGYCPENVILDDDLTGNEIITILKDIRDIPDQYFLEELAWLKNKLNVEDWFVHKKCSQYSQGMRKKTALMIAFIGKHNFYILDEPTNGLDPLAVFGLKSIITEKTQSGSGTLIASHMLDFVERVANTILILNNGTLIYSNTLKSIQKKWSDISLDEVYFNIINDLESNQAY